ncbi:unnamed protein product [Mycena citricolor]|uniref:Actin cytoskeleton organization protein n=1 Tax=Mycena citricolor TaxID=2018698 RepID=A0AAD2K412_9AGAR|nr:unnamed protein product [Mycena citricolor]
MTSLKSVLSAHLHLSHRTRSQALKALALVRSQKVEESLILCDEVLAAKSTNDAVLTAMMHVLRGLGRNKDIVVMFEEAYKQQPGSEDLAAQTFFANVRVQNWKAAQQVSTSIPARDQWILNPAQIAARMHKQFQEDRYVYWNVVGALLQANDPATPATMRTILYKLAHRLVTSSPTPSYVHAERFHLHLLIVRELQLFDEARTLLDSDVGKTICATSLVCNELRRDLWRLQGLLKEEGAKAESRIKDIGDRNWLEFLSVLDATFAELSSTTDDARERCSAEVSSARELFSAIAEKDGRKDRSGLLALLELEKRARAHGLSDDPERLIELMKRLRALEGTSGLSRTVHRKYELYRHSRTHMQPQASEPLLRRLINLHKLLRYNLPSSEVDEATESGRASLYTQLYLQALPLGADLPPTELQPADDLAILAGGVFVNLWKLSSDDKYLYSAASLLEFALTKSKQAFQMRILLVRIYRLLGAPAMALEHYRAMQVKQVQHDTLSHFLLSRSSTFSLATTGDLTLLTECVEMSQLYMSNMQDTGEYIIRAFTNEKYSQIPEFIIFEERLESSLQRDIVRIEHLRMRLGHEAITSDVIDMELIELKFIFDRLHHDNRDFDILADYHPKGNASLNEQTLLLGRSEGLGWFTSFLKLYIRALQQGSDLDETVEEKLLIGDRPKQTSPDNKIPLKERLCIRTEEELADLTRDELAFVKYADALANWLEPYHDFARPPPSVVLAEAAKVAEAKTGHPLRGVEIPPKSANGSANGLKKDEEPPAIVEPPQAVVEFFDAMKERFEQVKDESSPVLPLHVASLMQEAYLLFIIETLRFKTASVVKVHKLGLLVQHLKPLRTNAIAVLRQISSSLIKRSEQDGTADKRKIFVDGCASLQADQIDHDFILNVAKKATDSRKKVLDGIGKGIAKICTTYP